MTAASASSWIGRIAGEGGAASGGWAAWKSWLLVLALSCLVLIPGIASIPPTDRDESRYAVASTQMLESGDFVDIRFQDRPRYLQPAGIYWLQSAAVALTGGAEDRPIGAYRLPSLLGVLAAILATGLIASSLFGRRAGMAAALLLATGVAVGFEARIAKTDAMLLASVAAAQLAMLKIYLAPAGPRWRPALFWAALGVGMMIKGPIILLFVGLTVLALGLWDRRIAWLGGLRPLWGVPLLLIIVLPWYVAIGVQSDGQFYLDAVGQNLLGKVGESQQSHAGPPGYYLAAFTLTFWPGSLFVAFALYSAWQRRAEAGVRFLIAWAVPSWVVYELIATKLPHYVIPTYPALACLAAAALFAPVAGRAPVWLRGVAVVYAVVWLAAGALLAALGPAALYWFEGRLDPLLVAGGIAGFAAALAAAVLLLRRQRGAALLSGVVAGALVTVTIFGGTLPRLDSLWMSPRIVAAVEAARPCADSLLVSSAYREPSLVFLYGPYRTRLPDTPEVAAELIGADPVCSVALIDIAEADAFLARAAELGLDLSVLATLDGINYSNGNELQLTLYAAGPRGAEE